MFSEEELAYLQSQRLVRLATVAANGQPTVDAVGFQFDGHRFIVGGHNLPASRKYRNIAAGNTNVALIVDDVAQTQSWMPRGIKIHGIAEIVRRDGFFGSGEYLLITPTVSWSWGVMAPAFGAEGAAWHKIQWENE